MNQVSLMLARELAEELNISENLLKRYALIIGFGDLDPSDELSEDAVNRLIATWATGQPRHTALYGIAQEMNAPVVELIRICRRLGIAASAPNDEVTEYDAQRVRASYLARKGARLPPGWIVNHSHGLAPQSDQGDLEEGQFASYDDIDDSADFVNCEASGISGAVSIEGGTVVPRWPGASQYDEALLNTQTDFLVERLRNMHVMVGNSGESSIFSTGAFACVARVEIEGVQWALRMLVRSQDEIVERYRAIRTSQDHGELSELLAPVEYVENAVQIVVDEATHAYPVILVQWIDGLTFSRFVARACESGETENLGNLARAMRELRNDMLNLDLAHGDLSPDNMIVLETDSGLKVRLLDYDSVWFPEISHLRCSVSEEGDFQHPSRPNPIGPMADQIAFEMYDLTLRFIASGESVEGIRNLFDQRILLNREEWTDGISELAVRLQRFDHESYDRIARCLLGDYELVRELLPRREYSDVGNPKPEVGGGLAFDQVCAVLEISSGRLRQFLQRIGRSPDDSFSDADLEDIQRMVVQPVTSLKNIENDLSPEVREKQDPAEISIAVTARRIGLDVSSASLLVQDVVGRPIGVTSTISRSELDEVRARVREDRDFKFELTKVCQAAGVGPMRGMELLSDVFPKAICIRPYSIRVTAEGRNFLMGYLRNDAVGNRGDGLLGAPMGVAPPDSSQQWAPPTRKKWGIWRK